MFFCLLRKSVEGEHGPYATVWSSDCRHGQGFRYPGNKTRPKNVIFLDLNTVFFYQSGHSHCWLFYNHVDIKTSKGNLSTIYITCGSLSLTTRLLKRKKIAITNVFFLLSIIKSKWLGGGHGITGFVYHCECWLAWQGCFH